MRAFEAHCFVFISQTIYYNLEMCHNGILPTSSFLVSSADNLSCFESNLDSDYTRRNVGSDLDPNGLRLEWYSWKKFLKKLILKSADDNF